MEKEKINNLSCIIISFGVLVFGLFIEPFLHLIFSFEYFGGVLNRLTFFGLIPIPIVGLLFAILIIMIGFNLDKIKIKKD